MHLHTDPATLAFVAVMLAWAGLNLWLAIRHERRWRRHWRAIRAAREAHDHDLSAKP